MKTAKRTISGKQYNVEIGLASDIRSADNGLGSYSDRYMQVNLDMETNEIWGDLHVSLGRNNWIEYHDKNIITLGNYSDKNFKLSDLGKALERID